MTPQEDTYKTIESLSEAIYTEKRSKFLAFALPVRTLEEVKAHLETYQKRFYDARHVCYAYMLGAARKNFMPTTMASRRVLPESLFWDKSTPTS